jgi:hypothetical protein
MPLITQIVTIPWSGVLLEKVRDVEVAKIFLHLYSPSKALP